MFIWEKALLKGAPSAVPVSFEKLDTHRRERRRGSTAALLKAPSSVPVFFEN